MSRYTFIEILESRRLLSVSAASLFGPLTPGRTLTYQITNSSQNGTAKEVIKGPATFHGHAGTEVDDTSSAAPANITKSFLGFDPAGDAVSFGSNGTSLIGPFEEVNTPPAIDFPAQMDAGVTYTENWTTASNFNGNMSTDSTKHEVKLTSATLQSVTVPAGTFNAYLFNITDTITSGGFTLPGTATQEWYVPGTGLVKSVSTDSTTVLVPNQAVGAAAKLVVSLQPISATIGVAMTPAIKVGVADANGNLVTNNTSTVTLSIFSGPAGGVLSGTLSVAAVGGVATFTNVKVSVAGTYILQAKDGSLTLAKTLQIQVTANQTASKLVFVSPPHASTVGKPLSPSVVVGIETAAGDIVLNNTSKVTLAIASGPAGGTLGGTTAVNAVTGLASFTNLTFSKAGTYTIKATDGTLTATTSATFTIAVAATAAKLVYISPPHTGPVGKALTPPVIVAIATATGAVVTTDTSKVTLAIASGPAGGTLGGTVAVNAFNGVATFGNLTFSKPGTYTLKATDGTLTAVTSGTFVITAGAPAKLLFLQAPPAAGKALAPAIKVEVVDALGNLVTNDTSSVTIAISTGPAGGTLSGIVSVHAVGGIATFSNLSLNKVGAYKLKATDGSLTLATSGTITVREGVAAKLVIAQQPPASGTAGKALAPALKINVVDAFGNIVTSNTSTVTFSIGTGPAGGTLTGTVSAKAVAGVVTFSNLLLVKAGSYVLKAVDGGLTSALTSSFKIVAATASKLVFTQQPTSAVHGATLSAVKVAIEDTFGNIVLTNTTSLLLALASGPSGGVLSGTLSVKAVAGVATFSTLKLSKAGTYTLKATDGTLTAGVSKGVTVT